MRTCVHINTEAEQRSNQPTGSSIQVLNLYWGVLWDTGMDSEQLQDMALRPSNAWTICAIYECLCCILVPSWMLSWKEVGTLRGRASWEILVSLGLCPPWGLWDSRSCYIFLFAAQTWGWMALLCRISLDGVMPCPKPRLELPMLGANWQHFFYKLITLTLCYREGKAMCFMKCKSEALMSLAGGNVSISSHDANFTNFKNCDTF